MTYYQGECRQRNGVSGEINQYNLQMPVFLFDTLLGFKCSCIDKAVTCLHVFTQVRGGHKHSPTHSLPGLQQILTLDIKF